MSFVITGPEALASAASNLARIGSSVSQAHAAAAASTTDVIAPAADEVSAAIKSAFSQYASEYQALSARAAAFHSQFMQALNSGAANYAAAETANANPLQAVEQSVSAAVNDPFRNTPGAHCSVTAPMARP